MKKSPEEIVTILDELSEDANQWPYEIVERRRSIGVHQVDTNTSVQVQLDAMTKEIKKLTLASIHNEPHVACDICERGHLTHECQATTEEVDAVGSYNFNAMGKKQHVFSWSSPGGTANSWQQNNPRFQGQGAPDERLDAHGAAIKELGTGLRSLEIQVGQIATILSERIPDPTPIYNEVAPDKESGKELKIEDDEKTKKKKGKKGAKKKKKEETSRREESDDVSKHMHALPFPQKIYREKLDKQFERFLDMLREVNVNLPFIEFLSQMPAYTKFLKEILIKKRKIEETSVAKLTEHCSAILQNKLPQKCGDPRSFTIPCSLGTLHIDESLCDSVASINLISLSIYRKLEKEIGEIRSVPISLKLADQMSITPKGIVEDVLV
ncbi:PREDICTED: uncharacterized protein LOC109238117 [Nicotiana attenuata]|uniref:uncharacterized protein LOC109238117 n=1 Tax=Nicotiana attenuata TaxID=49451 RepID=UPI0009057DF9|nr:PREDICTED: uncharacterized protein LOC109238117 [Nicotiana attenuata]